MTSSEKPSLPLHGPPEPCVTLSPALVPAVIVLSLVITGRLFVPPLGEGRAVLVLCSPQRPHSQLVPVVALRQDPLNSRLL